MSCRVRDVALVRVLRACRWARRLGREVQAQGDTRAWEAQPAWLLPGPQRQPRFTSRSGICPAVSRPPVTAAPGGAAFLPGAPGRSLPSPLLSSSSPKACSLLPLGSPRAAPGARLPSALSPSGPLGTRLPPCVRSSCLACALREPSRVGSRAERRLPKDRPTETGRRNLVWKRVFADRCSQGQDLGRRLSHIRVAPV